MEIINNIDENKVLASELEAGDVFVYQGHTYLKIRNEDSLEEFFVDLAKSTVAPCDEWAFKNNSVQVVCARLTLNNYS